jgi:hypothetical protein
MDRTTRDESDYENEDTDNSEEQQRLSSDNTLEADIKFVSSEEDLLQLQAHRY